MNTREREVIRRAIAMALQHVRLCAPDVKLDAELEQALLILAEGSASGEGAEAVDWQVRRTGYMPGEEPEWERVSKESFDNPRLYDSSHGWERRALYTDPQPAQGEPFRMSQAAADAVHGIKVGEVLTQEQWDGVCEFVREQDSIIRSFHEQKDEHEQANQEVSVTDAVLLARWTLHEQRSCEGSERRPIADEVTERALVAFGEAIGEPFFDLDARDRELGRKGMRAALESALPRGLPAGSVKREDVEAFLVKYHAQVWEAAENGGEYDCAGRELAKQFLARFDATAEQPSCGQDARDAARYRWLRMANDRDDDGAPCIQVAESYPDFTNYPAGDKFDEAVDSFRHIAAQHRQGGEE